jgi:hypothetical protein
LGVFPELESFYAAHRAHGDLNRQRQRADASRVRGVDQVRLRGARRAVGDGCAGGGRSRPVGMVGRGKLTMGRLLPRWWRERQERRDLESRLAVLNERYTLLYQKRATMRMP